MRSTKSKVKKKDGKIMSVGKVYTAAEYKKFREYQTDYNKQHYRFYGFRLDKDKDQDLIEFVDDLDSLTPYIKTLLTREMKKGK